MADVSSTANSGHSGVLELGRALTPWSLSKVLEVNSARATFVSLASRLVAEISHWFQICSWLVEVVVAMHFFLRQAKASCVPAGPMAELQEGRLDSAAASEAELKCERPQDIRSSSTEIVVARTSPTREHLTLPCEDVMALRSESEQSPCVPGFDLVEAVKGLQGLKAALASIFASGAHTLPDGFRRGYVVDLDQHWITVHVMFSKSKASKALSLIVFDTLEVNYQLYYEVGLLRSSLAESVAQHRSQPVAPPMWENGVDVATLCEMLGIQYDISFLAPICDMRRLTWEEEEEIRNAKRASGSNATVYYDRSGTPHKKIIVQPILQAERDGTCRSRALAALGWLLRLDEKTLAWYVSNRALFHVELKVRRSNASDKALRDAESSGSEEDEPIFGSLMATGKRDTFGRDVHMKVCHSDTLRYNANLDNGCSMTTRTRCLPEVESMVAHQPLDSIEASLGRRRQEELQRIAEVLGQDPRRAQQIVPPGSLAAPDGRVDDEVGPTTRSVQRWREIEDHEARWQFLEETCFFGHNIGYKKIKKLYPREDVLSDNGVKSANSQSFGTTKYIRKYMVANNYVTHEADPMFNEPIEKFLDFLSSERDESIIVPFYVLPFPGCFVDLRLDDYVKGSSDNVDLDSYPDEHRRQKVSDYVIPSGNSFLNDPFSYNRKRATLSLPVKQSV